jgi:YidC/Oxa1 family membrane protein insertase
MFPLMLRVARNSSIFPTIYHRAKPILDETKRARASNDVVTMQKASNKLMTFYRDNGYSPFGGLTMLVQIPIFFSMFRMLWNGSKIPIPGWQTGGMWWFEDLTAIDPYFLLPTISGLSTCWTVMVSRSEMIVNGV